MRWLILFAFIAVVIWLVVRKRDKKPRPLKRIRHGRGGAEGGADTDFGDGGSDGGGNGDGGGGD